MTFHDICYGGSFFISEKIREFHNALVRGFGGELYAEGPD